MKIKIISILFIAATVSGCRMIGEDNRTSDLPIFTAGFEAANGTRTYLDDSYEQLWNANDEISIFYGTTFNRKYRSTGNTGDASASFEVVGDNDIYNDVTNISTNYAVYPYNAGISMTSDEKISLSLPAIQSYAEGSFAPGCNTMVATTRGVDDYFLPFKNLCGYVVVQFYGNDTVKSISLSGNNGEKIAGMATITASYGSEPIVEMKGDISTIWIDCADGVRLSGSSDKPTEFWFCVPPTTFKNGFTITATNAEGCTMTQSVTTARTVERNVINYMLPTEASFEKIYQGTKATLPAGPVLNAYIKGMDVSLYIVGGVADLESLNNDCRIEDINVKGIIFQNNSSCTTGVEIQDPSSEFPIYLNRNEASGLVVISTPAAQFATGESCRHMFYGLTACRHYTNINALNTEAATDMYYMFGTQTIADADVICLESLDLSSFNTENVITMEGMFRNLRMVKHLDLSSFNTSKVKSFRSTFYYANHIEELDLSNFDFSADTSLCSTFYCMERMKAIHFPEVVDCSNVENMRNLFHNCASLTKLDLTCFKNTENCNDMGYLCYDCGSLQEVDLTTIDFSLDTSMSYMFAYDTSLVNIKWADYVDCSNVQTMNYMFRQTHYSVYDLSKLKNISALTGCKYMFAYCPYLTKVIYDGDADFSALVDPSYMFYHSSDGLTVDLNDWDISTLEYLNYMFYGCWARELDITTWDSNNVSDFYYVFYNMRNCGTFRFGNDFVGTSHTRSTCFMSGASNKTGSSSASEQTGINVGSIKIYCGSDALSFIASRATVKYINDGYYNGTPCPVSFYDYRTNAPLTPANW